MSTYENQTGRLSPQSSLQNRYIIVGIAGRGGMGAVYEAIDTRLAQRRVAIKEMSQNNLSEEELAAATARFEREAAMLSALSHPNLPRILDAFSENERSYLVMDFIDGKTLFQLLKETPGRPLPLAQVVNYALQLCSVLAYLHQQNPPIIFRDIKPTNIMITRAGHLYLIDFGIARFFKEGQEQDTTLLGSPGYAPPEQHGIAQTNQRSDIYSLGATLHYCLTGQDPYYTKTQFSFVPVRQFNPTVPVELDQLLQRMLAQDERARPASMQEVQQALARVHQQAGEHTAAFDPAMPATQYVQGRSPSSTILPGSSRVEPQAPTVAVQPAEATVRTPLQTSSAPRVATSPWKPGFITLLSVLLVLSLGISALALSIFHPYYGWSLIVECVLALVLAVIAGTAITQVSNTMPRVLLLVTALVALITGVAFAITGSKDLQALLWGGAAAGGSYESTLALLFSAGLLVIAILSLCWLIRPYTLGQRIILFLCFGIALGCILGQMALPLDNISKHVLLLLALVVLEKGVLLAVQLERVYSQARVAMPLVV